MWAGFGFNILKKDSHYEIISLLDNSYASTVLKIGDMVVSLNNKDLSGLSQKDISEIIKNSKKDINITIERNKKAESYIIKNENYF